MLIRTGEISNSTSYERCDYRCCIMDNRYCAYFDG